MVKTSSKVGKTDYFLLQKMASLKSRLEHSVNAIALRSYLAEFISTFFFVFAAAGATMSSRKPIFFIYNLEINCLFISFDHGSCLFPLHDFLMVFIDVIKTGKMMPDSASDSSSLVAIAVANAFALSVTVYISANISGGHVNPAVTFGMVVGGHISIPMAIFYSISQTFGSVMACLLLKATTAGQVCHSKSHPVPHTKCVKN